MAWNQAVVTDAGRTLAAAVTAGKLKLEITEIWFGSGNPGNQETATELGNKQIQADIISIEQQQMDCVITFVISNEHVAENTMLSEIGVYALDESGNKILFSSLIDSAPATLPKHDSNAAGYKQRMTLAFGYSNAEKVELHTTVSEGMPKEDVEAFVSNQIDAHNTDRASHADFTGATAEAPGIRGMVPAVPEGGDTSVLKGNGKWGKLNVSNLNLEEMQPSRGLRATLDAAVPLALLPTQCLLQKLRTDYTEFAIYTPIATDGIRWARWYFTNRFNAGNRGSARMVRCSEALLYKAHTIAPHAGNMTTETEGREGTSPTHTYGTNQGVTSGSWSSVTTVNGIKDVRFSTVPGDSVTYTVHDASRIVARVYGGAKTLGGKATVYITNDQGQEIAKSNYCLPIINDKPFMDQTIWTGLLYIPLADKLPKGTYTVKITVDETNTNRVYDGGIRVYDTTPNTTPGIWGTWENRTERGTLYNVTYYPGAKVIYSFTGTKLVWRIGLFPNSGVSSIHVFDSKGNEIADTYYDGFPKLVDSYSAAAIPSGVTICHGLPKDTYYVVAETLAIKNEKSDEYRLYDAGCISYDETQKGVLGQDEFDTQGINDGDEYQLGTHATLLGTGNLEMAALIKKVDAPKDAWEYAGGTHGYETNPTDFVIKADDDIIDYASAERGETWIAERFAWTYGTTLLFKDETSWADVSWDCQVSTYGYCPNLTRTTVTDAVVYEDYILMYHTPNVLEGTRGIDGGFENVACNEGGNYTPKQGGPAGDAYIPQGQTGFAAWNKHYASYGFLTNYWEFVKQYADSKYNPIGQQRSLLQDRTDQTFKLYTRIFPGNNNSGILIKKGDTYTSKKIYRVFYLPNMALALNG